jgi:putative peptidoglycan lipid II flippase
VALLLGTSPAADAFILAFRIPNMIRRMTGEGALGASFIPVFVGYLRGKPRGEAWAFAQRMFWDMAVVLGAVAALGCIFSKQVIGIFTLLGLSSIHWDLAIFLNRIIFPCVFFLGLAALGAAILNSFHVFGLPASTSAVFNLVFILFSVGAVYRPILRWTPEAYRTPAVALAIGILAGAALQLAVLVPALWKRGMRFRPDVTFSDPGVRKVGKLMTPIFFGVGVFQVNFFVDTIFATSSRMPTGSITSLYVADRVMELVLGAYAMSLATAILPTMSHQAADGKYEEMKRTFEFGVRVVSFITIPAAVGLILLRVPITKVLFQHGQFMAESTALTAHRAAVLLAGAAGVCGDQADHADVLLDARHHDADARGSLFAGAAHRAQRVSAAGVFALPVEREPGAGEFAGGLFQFRHALFHLPGQVRRAGSEGNLELAGQDGGLRAGHGGGMFRGAEVFGFCERGARCFAGRFAGGHDSGIDGGLFRARLAA